MKNLNYDEHLYESEFDGPFRGYEQSVTLHAQMDRGDVETPGTEMGWFLWGITADQLPILIGICAGGLVLIFTMIGLLMWRCCRYDFDQNKAYYLQQNSDDVRDKRHKNVMQSCSESMVFLNSKQNGMAYQSCLVEKKTEVDPKAGITRSQSAPVKEQEQQASSRPSSKKQRPISQPLHFNPSDVSFAPRIHTNIHGVPYHMGLLQLPNIPEGSLHNYDGTEPYSQYASSSVLDEAASTKIYPHHDLRDAAMKTRSLPAWVRSRSRPLSTEDDLNELYAKVNFSKKRKNRMRNDSAAAIALNKSRSQFIQFPFMHKDTDSLVDNEAVVVYDERTAL